MVRLALAVLATTSAIGFAQAQTADPIDAIKANCATEWGDDYRMQKYCRERQLGAFREVTTIRSGIGADKVRSNIMNRCASEWPAGATYDWRMVAYCYKKQLAAFEDLQR